MEPETNRQLRETSLYSLVILVLQKKPITANKFLKESSHEAKTSEATLRFSELSKARRIVN